MRVRARSHAAIVSEIAAELVQVGVGDDEAAQDEEDVDEDEPIRLAAAGNRRRVPTYQILSSSAPAKITKAQALQSAQLELLHKYKAPFYWTLYVLVGNWL